MLGLYGFNGAVVYDELRRLAAHQMARQRPGQTLQATALVHEAYLRLVGEDEPSHQHWGGSGHFFAAAAEAMRRILIDRARQKQSLKRGGDQARTTWDESTTFGVSHADSSVFHRSVRPATFRPPSTTA